MQIHGLQKMTLLDYPGKVACTVFIAGCNYACPYCHNSQLQTRYTSGTVSHAFLGEKLPDWKAAADLVRKIAENHKLP